MKNQVLALLRAHSVFSGFNSFQIRGAQSITALLFVLVFQFMTQSANAQLTGTLNVPGSYATLELAIADLNVQGVGPGGVTINLVGGNPQTAPAGGYTITTLTSTLANPITIQGNGNTITASAALTVGSINDAIFKIIGGDYITIQNFTLIENAGNIVTALATNNMNEFGVAIFYATVTDGAKNITIQNNTITLNRTYANTFGIFSTTRTNSTALTTAAENTTVAGANDNLHIYSNTISNVNMGIVAIGSLTGAGMATGLDIGGGSGATANTISDFGTTNAISSYVSVSGTVNGILVNNHLNSNISFNTIQSSNGGTILGTLRGIYNQQTGTLPTTGTNALTFNNNNVSLKHGLNTGIMLGIANEMGGNGSGVISTSLTINSNDFNNFTNTAGSPSGTVTFISHITVALLNKSYNSNTFTNLNLNTTGSVTFFVDATSLPATGSETMSGNSIVTGFTKTGSGGTVTIRSTAASSVAGATIAWNFNNFSNITLSGSTLFTGFSTTDGGAPTKTITNNTINNLTISGGTSGAITGISASFFGGTTSSVSNNTITNITGQGAITGINIGTTGTATTLNITGNTVTGLISNGTGGTVTGIAYGNPSTTGNISNNIINNLSSTGLSSTIFGISVTGGATVNVNSNTVNTLVGSGTTSPLCRGISVSSGTTVNIFKNKIYDLLESGSISTTASAVNGILLSGGTTVTTYNNLIGDLRAPAASLTDAIRGISVTSTSSSSTQNVYYNTVYISGTSSGTNFGTTGIFHTASATATTATLNLRNNIIANNATFKGTGLVVAFRRSTGTAGTLANYANTSNNNHFFAGVLGGNASSLIYSDGTSSAQTINDYKNGMFTAGTIAPRDAVSITEDLSGTFLSTTGASVNFLHINTAIPTQVESGASPIVSFTDDFDGDARNGTTPDIGADEGNFIIADFTGPVISYTPLANSCNTSAVTLNATITDASGVPTAGLGLPVLYWKINAGAYTAATGTFISGNSYQFSFGSGVVLSDVVSYYIVAQDNASTPNVSASPSAGAGGFSINPPAVSTPPSTPSTYTVVATLSGTYTVGAGGDYATLTAAIADYHAKCIGGPIVFSLTDAAYDVNETFPITINAHPLAGANTLTIKPGAGVTALISGSNTTSLITLNGADNVIFDGSNNGTSTKDMTFRNTSTSGNAFRFINDATNNIIRNTIVESANTSTTSGTILFSTTTFTLGNSNNTILNCDVRDRSDAAGVPANAIYSSGSAGGPNANNTISGCNIFNWTNVAVLVSATGAGNGWTINPSSFYQTAARTTAMMAISILGGSGHNILNNSIGGTAPNAGGSHMIISNTFRGINLSVGTTSATSVQGNVIKNIRSTFAGDFTASYGIYLVAGMANIGNISGNTIGSSNVAERFEISGDSYGIRVTSTSTVNLHNNTVDNFGTAPGVPTGEWYFGILVEGTGGTHSIINNTVSNITNGSTPDASFNSQTTGMIISATGIQTVSGNIIHDIGCTSLNAPTAMNNRIWGLIISGTAAGTVVEKNKIYNIYGSSSGVGARADVITGLQSQTIANATYSNNMVSCADLSGSSDRLFFGILDLSASPAVSNYYFNSVNIYGTATGANPSYAFNRNNTATVTIKDNIFNNSRSGGTGFHVAIANTNAAATGWAPGASNYNDLYSVNPANLAQWLGSLAGNNRDLPGWQASQGAGTPGSEGDINSVSIAAIFNTPTDLHLTPSNGSLDNIGTPAGSITVDIDGDTRNVTTPDMGADEFGAIGCTGAEGGTASVSGPSTFCGSGIPMISATGYSVGIGSGYQWQSSVDFAFTTPIDIVGQTNPATLTLGTVSATTYYRLKVTCTSGTATDFSNVVTITINPIPTASISPAGPITLCEPNTQLLTATSSATSPSYQWKKDGVNVGGNSNTYTATATGSYTVVVTDGVTSCFNTSNAVMVTINLLPPAAIITPSSVSLCASDPAQLLTASGSTVNASVTVSSGPINLAIPDEDLIGVSSGLIVNSIPTGSTIDSIVVTVDIMHTWVEDVDIIFVGPNASVEELSTDNGGSLDNYTNTRLTSDPAKPSITTGTPPFTGTFKAEGTLSNLWSTPNGTWTLNVADDEAGITGTLNSWSLKIYYQAPADITWSITPGVYTGLFTDAGATTAYAGEISNTVYALPATSTTYTATATNAAGCTSTSTVDVFVNGLQVQNTNNSGGGSLRDVIGCATPGSTVTFAPGLMAQTINLTGGEIVINKNLTISGLGMLNLTLSGNNANRIFHLQPGNNLEIENLSMKNGFSATNGGAILIEGALILENALLQNNFQGLDPRAYTLLPPGTVDIQGTVDVKN